MLVVVILLALGVVVLSLIAVIWSLLIISLLFLLEVIVVPMVHICVAHFTFLLSAILCYMSLDSAKMANFVLLFVVISVKISLVAVYSLFSRVEVVSRAVIILLI